MTSKYCQRTRTCSCRQATLYSLILDCRSTYCNIHAFMHTL